MNDTETAATLHSPITNILSTETRSLDVLETEGSNGPGDSWPLSEDKKAEFMQVEIRESAMEFAGDGPSFQLPDTSELPDIGVASYGEPPKLELVIGTDERIRITDTTSFPFRATAFLLITAADNSQWIGTGWFISPRVLITAGHCVNIQNSSIAARNGWVKQVQVMPGRDAGIIPYGGITSTEFWSVAGWGSGGLEICDYGAIILPKPFDKELGFIGYGSYPDHELLGAIANLQGYPTDRKPDGSLWYDKREISSVNADKVYYAADTAGGQSGAGVYIIKDGKRIAVAIHAYGGTTANSGTRISPLVYGNLEQWKSKYK